MTSLLIENCEIGSITSRADHSVKFSVITPELLPSHAGELCQWHGRAATVHIKPHDRAPEETIHVNTERGVKSNSQRFRGVLFVAWRNGVDLRPQETFDTYADRQWGRIIEEWKAKLP